MPTSLIHDKVARGEKNRLLPTNFLLDRGPVQRGDWIVPRSMLAMLSLTLLAEIADLLDPGKLGGWL